MGKIALRMTREIKNNLGQFLSLVLVIAVGSFMFTGLFATIRSIQSGVDQYYDQQKMPDLWIRFAGIDDEQIESLAKQMDMEAQGRYNRTFDATMDAKAIAIRLCSMTTLSSLELKRGALPAKDNEVVVDSKFAKANALELGSVLTIAQQGKTIALTVTGVADSPENAWKINAGANVKQESFAVGYTTKTTMVTLIETSESYREKLDELNEEFTDPQHELDDAKDDLQEKEADFSQEQSDALQKLEESKENLSDAGGQIHEANADLESGKADQESEIADARQKIADARKDLDESQAELDAKKSEAEVKFAGLYNDLAAAQAQVNAKQAELNATSAQIAKAQSDLETQKATVIAQFDKQLRIASETGLPADQVALIQTQKDEALNAIAASETELTAKKKTIDESQSALTKQSQTLTQNKQALDMQKKMADMELTMAQNKIDDARHLVDLQEQNVDMGERFAQDKIDSAQKQIEQKTESYEKAIGTLDEQQTELDEKLTSGRESLNDAWSTYYEKEQEFLDKQIEAKQELDRALLTYSEVLVRSDDPEAVINLMSEQEHFIATIERKEYGSAKAVQGGIDLIGVVSYVFPVVFFLVASLIAFISLSKMVENQRMQIAVMEAMGIAKAEILSGYVFYSFFASLLGSFGAAALGNRLVPALLTKLFANRFLIPLGNAPTYWMLICLPFVFGFVFSGTAAILASRSVFREVPAQAMRPKAPKKTKPILLERFSFFKKLSYGTKLICRNIFLNKKKIFLSSVGVIGCVTLVLMGLSVQSSAAKLLKLVEDSAGYDMRIDYDEAAPRRDIDACPVPLTTAQQGATLRATLPDADEAAITLLILPKGSEMVHNVDSRTGEPLFVAQKGVIIPRNLAQEHAIETGDTIKILCADTAYRIRVTAIAEQYQGNNVLLSNEYADALELPYDLDQTYVTLKDKADAAKAGAYFAALPGVRAVTDSAEDFNSAKDSLAMLNLIVKIIVLAAGILTVTVIYNITSIQIFERTRELATLRVLGYTKNEAGRLVFAENLVITGVGYVLGLPLGAALFQTIVIAFRRSGIFLPAAVTMKNMGIALVLVYGLSMVTNLLLKRRIVRIDLVESLKGVD